MTLKTPSYTRKAIKAYYERNKDKVKNITFTLKENDQDIKDKLASLPKGTRTDYIKEAIRSYQK